MSDAKTDIWMPLYVGDFLADTSHLDAERSGCYLLWLMHYWRKGPLTANVNDLVGIGKLRGDDAPSIAQALLVEFFKLEDDGLYHQKRSDREIAKWPGKRLKAKEKASIAAKTRWGNHAPSITPSITPSNQQAMLGSCPSPSPSQVVQIPSRAKRARAATKTDLLKAKHAEFKSIIAEYWESKNAGDPITWDGQEGMQLDKFLRATPDITAERFRELLRNRFKSDVTHGDRPSLWIGRVMSYNAGPIDRFGKTIGAPSSSAPTIRLHQFGDAVQ